MITIVVREVFGLWRVEREDEVLRAPESQEGAVIFALDEASRSFEAGRRAEVVFRPEH